MFTSLNVVLCRSGGRPLAVGVEGKHLFLLILLKDIGRPLYPLSRFGFSFGICRHLTVALLNVAIYDVAVWPDQ